MKSSDSCLKHIAIIAPNCRAGSVWSVAWRHAVELSRWFEVHVLTTAMPALRNEHIHPEMLEPRQYSYLHRFCHVPNALAFERCALRHLRGLCEHFPVEAVWCHGHASVVLAAKPLQRRYGFRIVMTTHGDICDRPPGTYSREMTWYYRYLTPRAYRYSDVTQAISPYMADLAKSGGAGHVAMIPHGVDPAGIGLDAFPVRAPESYRQGGVVRLLFVGNLLPVKGVDVLLAAMKRINESAHSSAHVILDVVGGGHARARYETYVRDNHLERIVKICGPIPRDRLGALYREADILCVPSLSEPFGLVAIEGMACGLPVVGSRVGGLAWLIQDGQNGRLVDPGDPVSLAVAICDLASSRDRLVAMGLAAQTLAASQFVWEVIAGELRGIALCPRDEQTH